ncbi:hypothetical protein DM02DRAFT_603839 [Periconia macrospinosa]|uniref:ABM domain-containing protein n=1 Tax=Periconia macrospinosa TaxID=97972 RepID=A0A2V1D675_9PLEO|nr:hypothetical protein DM02DRAFT_603839 [Periconia macrospinosa]
MTITEVGRMTIKPGIDVTDETTSEGQILTGIWNSLIAAPGGPLRIFWGTEVENPLKLWAFFDWDSVEDHEQFASSHGVELTKDFPKILTDGEFTKHIAVQPYPPDVLRSPVTEVMLAYFPTSIQQATKDANTARFKEFAEKGLRACASLQGLSYGWGIENDFPVRDAEGEQKGTVFTALIGWPSVEAHMEFRETDAFKENIHLARGMEEMVKVGMFHVKFKGLQRKEG